MIELSETRKDGGWCEIAVRVDGQLQAVVTHPCTGGKWIVHFVGQWKKERFKTRKAALDYVRETLWAHFLHTQ